MKITLVVIGKTDLSYLQEGIAIFSKRLKHYVPFEIKIIPDLKKAKNLSQTLHKNKEGALILQKTAGINDLVLLDEGGKSFSSREFAVFLQKKMVAGTKELVFVIGGAYGFSEEVYKKAEHKVSLSKMTFSHQMIRLFFVEQVYRAFTIINNEPYHNG